MRDIDISDECEQFILKQDNRTKKKFLQIIEVLEKLAVPHCKFVKELSNSPFYELGISSGNEIRVIIFTIDHVNIVEATKVVCLTGFVKKSTKDYRKAIDAAERILRNYTEK